MKTNLHSLFKSISKGSSKGRVIKKGIPLGKGKIQKELEKTATRIVNKLIDNADKGNFFGAKKKYTPQYKIKKGSGKAVPKGRSQASKSTKPNLKLSGEMLNSLTFTITEKGIEIGWFSKEQVKKVLGNKDNKRYLFFKEDIPKDVIKLIDKEIGDIISSGLTNASHKVRFNLE